MAPRCANTQLANRVVSDPTRLAVLGNPIDHSLSPEIHQQFAAQFGRQINYGKQRLESEGFSDFVRQFFASGGAGLNVTVPFKIQAYECADWHDNSALQAGAANTLSVTDEGIGAWNTDGLGLVNDLISRHGFDLAHKNILIIGAGGATQGILGPLLARQPAAVAVANRTEAKAIRIARQALVRYPQCSISVLGLEELSETGEHFDLIINSTSLGLDGGQVNMHPRLTSSAFCYDLSYGQSARFAKWARATGAGMVADGLGMLVEQAALSFSIWFGDQPATDEIYQRLAERIDND